MNKFKYLNKNSNELHWKLWVVLLVEVIGTFFMVFEIILPSAIALGDSTMNNLPHWLNTGYNIIFGTYIMKAFWVTGFILLLIYICRKVSVNLNPAVTLSEAVSGHHTWGKAFSMIGIQFLGAFAAASFALGCSHWSGAWDATMSSNNVGTALDGVQPRFLVGQLSDYSFQHLFGWNKTSLIPESNIPLQLAISPLLIIIEAAFTFALISTVIYFPKAGKITEKWRPLLIAIPLTITVCIGIHTDNIALNPARLIAPAVVSTVAGGPNSMQWIWVFLSGELIAVGVVGLIEYWRKTGFVKLPENIFGPSAVIEDDSKENITKKSVKKNTETITKKITKK